MRLPQLLLVEVCRCSQLAARSWRTVTHMDKKWQRQRLQQRLFQEHRRRRAASASAVDMAGAIAFGISASSGESDLRLPHLRGCAVACLGGSAHAGAYRLRKATASKKEAQRHGRASMSQRENRGTKMLAHTRTLRPRLQARQARDSYTYQHTYAWHTC